MRNLLKIIVCGLFVTNSAFAVPYRGSEIVFSAANAYAVHAAQKIAESGGNVVDVAVTLVLAMSVTNPQFSTLGGGGFAMVKMGKAIEVLDFRERAPLATNPNFFENKSKDASMTGGAAVAVPGTPAGLWELHKKYGKIHWSRLLDEPIQLAQKGFRVSGELSDDLKNNAGRFNLAAKQYFLKNATTAYAPGEILVQKNYAKALSEMRNRNIASFYSGQVAKDIVSSVAKAGGVITLKDLESYKPVWRQPLKANYADHTIYLMPPPSSGGIVIETALQMIEKLKLTQYGERSADEFHLLGQIFNRAFRSRSLIADPDHFNVEIQKLLDKKYIESLTKNISLAEATTEAPLHEGSAGQNESPQTTHLSVIDKFGNAVAITLTLNGDFGSGVATDQYGIMLNNEMDDFTTRPNQPNMFGLVQGNGNMIAPGKRPLSSMSPTLVEKNGKIIMALGAPGGPRIISSVIQVLYRTLGRKNNLEAAIEAPRVHQQNLPNKLFIDDIRFSPEVLTSLEARKNVIEKSWQGKVFAVMNNNGVLEAVYDSRNEGAAGGF